MKRRNILLLAILAAAVALPSLVAASNQPSVIFGPQDLDAVKDNAGRVVLDPAGPYVLKQNEIVKVTNLAGKNIKVVFKGRDVNGNVTTIQSTDLVLNASVQRTQGAPGALDDIKDILVKDMDGQPPVPYPPADSSNAQVYAQQVPGLGATGLVALAILLTGAGAWVVSRKRTAPSA